MCHIDWIGECDEFRFDHVSLVGEFLSAYQLSAQNLIARGIPMDFVPSDLHEAHPDSLEHTIAELFSSFILESCGIDFEDIILQLYAWSREENNGNSF